MVLLEEQNSNQMQLLGVGIVKILNYSINNEIDIIFQKGIGNKLIRKIINKNKEKILEKRQGISIDLICNFTIYNHFFNNNQDEIVNIIYIDKKEKILNFSDLFNISKQLNECIYNNYSLSKIEDFCNKRIKLLKCEGLLAIFIIGSAGHLFLSKINKSQTKLLEHELPISGFISAILSFSKEVIGKEPGVKLKQINLGNQRFYVNLEKDAIFAYLVRKERILDPFRRYMHLISEEFLDIYGDKINPSEFNGEVTQFEPFESVVDQYFII